MLLEINTFSSVLGLKVIDCTCLVVSRNALKVWRKITLLRKIQNWGSSEFRVKICGLFENIDISFYIHAMLYTFHSHSIVHF